jgi:hypothetical protein
MGLIFRIKNCQRMLAGSFLSTTGIAISILLSGLVDTDL